MLPHTHFPAFPLGAGEMAEEHLCGGLQLYLQFQGIQLLTSMSTRHSRSTHMYIQAKQS